MLNYQTVYGENTYIYIYNYSIYRHNWIQFIGSIVRIQNAEEHDPIFGYNDPKAYGFTQEQMEIQFMGNHSQNDGWIRLNNL